MCFGGRGGGTSSRNTKLTSSIERGGTQSNQSILSSNPKSAYTTKSALISSPSVRSTTGPSNRTGGFSSYSNRKKLPRGSFKETEGAVPEEVTARSPTMKGSTEEGKVAGKSKTRVNKSIALDKVDMSSKLSDEDVPTLRNQEQTKAEATNGADHTEVNDSEWSIMGKTTMERKKTAAQKEAARKALRMPSRTTATPPPPPPPPPSRPTPPTSIPLIPSPTTTPPPVPPQVSLSNEKTAMTTLTVKTQRTLMDEENQLMLSTHGRMSRKDDVSVDMEMKNPPLKIGGKSTTIQL